MSLYLCVDSSSVELLAGPSNVSNTTIESFIETIRLTVGDALKTCSSPASVDPVALPPPAHLGFAAVWFGIAGADSPSIIESATNPLSVLLGIPKGPRLSIANDAHLLAAPIRFHADVSFAVTVIGGTGSIVVSFAEKEDGELEELGRVGGWGWLLGDEGGGYSVGREAVRQVLEEQDKHSILTVVYIPDPASSTAILPDHPAHTYMTRKERLSSLSPLVFTAAFEHNDPLALNVLQTCAEYLADQIDVLVGDASEESPRLVKASESVICFGGSLVGLEGYRKIVLDELESKGHVFKCVEFVGDCAAVGAAGLRMKYQN
ncbi:hypothetical protein BT96DRAFT_924681 [Gymnopus androsaceus JB14]|uniref:N-acetyl-D-glucosamine kinase n=1 Tax=Gymnopus androsaceus JB14 TaxID=1447944 RepID=A0A6A4H5N1_9AGAR|nr:hypothetical protein BT96DRAFT_924681 [Gymnopus androsaceus JB14]